MSFYILNTSSSDRDLTYAFVGIIVNMMSDPEQRPQFQQQVQYLDKYNNMENRRKEKSSIYWPINSTTQSTLGWSSKMYQSP